MKKKFKKFHRDKIIKNIFKKYKVVLSTPKFVNERWPYIKNKLGVPNLKNTKFLADNTFCVMMHPNIKNKDENFLRFILKEELDKLL